MTPIDHHRPISPQDYQKFVFDSGEADVVNPNAIPPKKPFSLKPPEKSEKTTKDLKKNKDQREGNTEEPKKEAA